MSSLDARIGRKDWTQGLCEWCVDEQALRLDRMFADSEKAIDFCLQLFAATFVHFPRDTNCPRRALDAQCDNSPGTRYLLPFS
jgi:hypothetical protein